MGDPPVLADALKDLARLIRETQGGLVQGQNNPSHTLEANLTNGVMPSPAVTLYQSSPIPASATTGGGLQPPPNLVSNQPLRQGQNAPQGSGDTSSPLMVSTPASAQTPTAPPLSAGPSTPMLKHTTNPNKRKADETSSPTMANNAGQPPPAKRTQRKRSVRQNAN